MAQLANTSPILRRLQPARRYLDITVRIFLRGNDAAGLGAVRNGASIRNGSFPSLAAANLPFWSHFLLCARNAKVRTLRRTCKKPEH